MSDVIVDAFIAVIICYSITLSLEKVFAKKHGYTIHPNQVSSYMATALWNILMEGQFDKLDKFESNYTVATKIKLSV